MEDLKVSGHFIQMEDVQQLNKLPTGILDRNYFRKGSITCQRF